MIVNSVNDINNSLKKIMKCNNFYFEKVCGYKSSSNEDKRINLYVAMTRAMHNLCINYNGELPTALKKISENKKILKK